jgi:hypothetical protein
VHANPYQRPHKKTSCAAYHRAASSANDGADGKARNRRGPAPRHAHCEMASITAPTNEAYCCLVKLKQFRLIT